eukprot:TRINITY_DN14751_c0_g1_i1.p1 TRINITY_DN14751_c0_g1~~TRINITY_DN14751_c0_g1_i1.p1  ORF type:complete len:123 (+),score=20.43 TRINITY_DN14751_c0_g1_i1:84-452(+)
MASRDLGVQAKSPVKQEFADKSSAVLYDTAQSLRSLIKNSDLREELMRTASSFANQEATLKNTYQTFKQMEVYAMDLSDKASKVDASLQEVMKVAGLFQDTAKAFNLDPPPGMPAASNSAPQ